MLKTHQVQWLINQLSAAAGAKHLPVRAFSFSSRASCHEGLTCTSIHGNKNTCDPYPIIYRTVTTKKIERFFQDGIKYNIFAYICQMSRCPTFDLLWDCWIKCYTLHQRQASKRHTCASPTCFAWWQHWQGHVSGRQGYLCDSGHLFYLVLRIIP